ncbi:MAG: phycobiliprotein lyase [Spirulinaceae cyanobacterium SM2_1_0]|nr:phycobiliprotein lyase [Spirulinaceae cyanobacterium SM2_1_0]
MSGLFYKPMDIEQFFAQSEGKWFSQRTDYQLATQQADNGKAELTVTCLSATEPSVVQLAERAGIAADQVGGGLQTSWDTSQDWQQPQQLGSALLVVVPTGDRAGTLLRSVGTEFAQGHYAINADASLTLSVISDGCHMEERLWFASENLRLRTSTVKRGESFKRVAFYSEIRRLPPSA